MVEVIRGKDAILAVRKPLEVFAQQCGQPDSLHWLDYFLQNRRLRGARSYLVLVRRPESAGKPLETADLEGAALYFEYGTRWLRTWAFVSDELVARDADRGRVAALTLEAILACGAHAVVITYRRAATDLHEPGPMLETRDALWAQQSRSGKRSLTLADTYEETLARFGKSTRFNFRYYRKRFQNRFQPEFIADARTVMTEEDALELNDAARNPVSRAEVRLRYESSAQLPGGFLAGLRDRDGEWISAIGGWRSGEAAVVHWQANSKRFPKDSVINVIRSMFLEHLCSEGVRELFFIGGTTHSMHHVFEPEVAFDVFVRRQSKRAALLRFFARPLASPSQLVQHENFLAMGLRSKSLQWHPTRLGAVPTQVREPRRARPRQIA